MRDISDWERVGYGGKSTLDKEELLSPEKQHYLIKYPRVVKVGVSWEDITELIAAEIGSILGLETMDVEIVMRNGRRGCLLKNFVMTHDTQPNAIPNEEGGVLLSSDLDYTSLLESPLNRHDLIEFGFSIIKRLPYWNEIRKPFVKMQFFDMLIGNQDRHPYNWLLLFHSLNNVSFSPIYDNGASLGFRFDDKMLEDMMKNEPKLNKYTKKTKLKAGLFEHKQVKIKDLLNYLINEYPMESKEIIDEMIGFDFVRYNNYILQLPIISDAQKKWLINIIPFRRQKILQWIGREE